jgi:predicted amidophosphoribosyltransferase
VCPVCTTKLRQACVNCKAPLETLWQICPYCETPVETPTTIEFPPAPRRERPSG